MNKKAFRWDAKRPLADRTCFIMSLNMSGVPCTVRYKLNELVREVPVQWSLTWAILNMSGGRGVLGQEPCRGNPPPGGQTDTTENITFPTPLAGRKNYENFNCWWLFHHRLANKKEYPHAQLVRRLTIRNWGTILNKPDYGRLLSTKSTSSLPKTHLFVNQWSVFQTSRLSPNFWTKPLIISHEDD